MTGEQQPIKRKPGRPRIVLTPNQERLLVLAELRYKEYRRVQKVAIDEARQRVAEHRKLAADAARAALDTGISQHRLSVEVINSSDKTVLKNLLREGEEHHG